jgi:hypothetical protein
LALIAQVPPVVKIETVDTDPPAIVGLTPDTLVATPPVAGNDSVNISSRSVPSQLFGESGDNGGYRIKPDVAADPSSFGERWIRREEGVRREVLAVQSRVKSANPPSNGFSDIDLGDSEYRAAIQRPADKNTELVMTPVHAAAMQHSNKLADRLILRRAALVASPVGSQNHWKRAISLREKPRRWYVVAVSVVRGAKLLAAKVAEG